MNTPENPYEPDYEQNHGQDAGQPMEYHYVPDPPKPTFWKRLVANKFLFISILVHVVFALGATYYIVQRNTEKAKLTFKPASTVNNPTKRALEHKVSMAQKKKAGGAPPQAKRIATTGASKIALPDIPMISSATTVVPNMAAGMGGMGMGTGTGIGNGGGSMGAGGPPGFNLFGFKGTSGGLVGVFYDLKQSRDRKAPPPGRGYMETVKGFVEGGMKDDYLKDYFRAPQKLMATQFIIPRMDAEEAPKAYGVEKDVKPSQWLAVYRGKVQPPTSGDWCFLAEADDIILVAINGKLILDGSWHTVANPPENGKVAVNYANSGNPKGGYIRSQPIHFNEGEWADMMVAIGEWPGGKFWAVLGAEQAHGNGGNGGKNVPLFKTAAVKVPPLDPAYPEIDVNARPWRVQGGAGGGTGSLLDALRR
jgi:hypothetical protein